MHVVLMIWGIADYLTTQKRRVDNFYLSDRSWFVLEATEDDRVEVVGEHTALHAMIAILAALLDIFCLIDIPTENTHGFILLALSPLFVGRYLLDTIC